MSQKLQGIPGIPEKLWNLTLSNFLQGPGNSLKATPDKLPEFYGCIKNVHEKAGVLKSQSLNKSYLFKIFYLQIFES